MSTTISANDVISHLAAVYGRAIQENFNQRINMALTGNPQKDGMVETMNDWLSQTLQEVAPGPMVIQVSGGAPAQGGNQGIITPSPFGTGFGAAMNPGGAFPGAASGQPQASNGSCPEDGSRELQGLGVSARVPVTSQNHPAGIKCGIKFGKKGFGSNGEKFYCIKDATEVNPNTNTWTCKKHAKNKTTGDTASKSGARLNPVVAASEIQGINNGMFAPNGVTPNAQQIQQVGHMMTQNPIHIQPVNQNTQGPQPGLQQNFQVPPQAAFNPSNQLFTSVSQDLKNLPPNKSIQEGGNQVSFGGNYPPNSISVGGGQQQQQTQQFQQQQPQFRAPGQFNASQFNAPANVPSSLMGSTPAPQQQFQQPQQAQQQFQPQPIQNIQKEVINETDEDEDDEEETQAPQQFQQPQQQQQQAPVDQFIAQAQPVQSAPSSVQGNNGFDVNSLIAKQQQQHAQGQQQQAAN